MSTPRTIPAQELKRRGIGVVDGALKKGPVHVLKNNRPSYVVLSEEQYEELLEAKREAFVSRLRESLEDLKAGRVTRHKSAEALIESLRLDEQSDEEE